MPQSNVVRMSRKQWESIYGLAWYAYTELWQGTGTPLERELAGELALLKAQMGVDAQTGLPQPPEPTESATEPLVDRQGWPEFANRHAQTGVIIKAADRLDALNTARLKRHLEPVSRLTTDWVVISADD